MNLKNILLSCVSCVVLTGCYTQLAMFYPEPEIEQDEEQFYETYSRAVPRPLNVGIYAQDGAGTPLGMAYQMMYSRFQPFFGFGNRYSYYLMQSGIRSPYYHGGYYSDIGGYTMYIPVNTGERKIRTFSTSRDNDSSPETNLNITRTRTTTNSSSNSGYSNSSNVSVTRGTSSSSSSSGGRRVTRRN